MAYARCVGPGKGDDAIAFDHSESCRLPDGPGHALELGHRDRPKVEPPFGLPAETDHGQTQPVLARLMTLLHEVALLERRQKARSCRLVESETARQFGDPRLPIPVP